MVIFSCTKKDFMFYVEKEVISNKVYYAYKQVMGKKSKLSQIKSWANSLPFMAEILEDLPDDVGIAMEYGIPLTSKRVDLMISGYDMMRKPVVMVVELKQWEYASTVPNLDAIVKTFIGDREICSLHPAYQVLGYKELMENYNVNINEKKIRVIPVVYLHNYDLREDDDLFDNKYRPYYKKVAMFGRRDTEDFKALVTNTIAYGDSLEVMKLIEESEIKPTKKLLDVMHNMLGSKKEFTLLDEQKEIAEEITRLARLCFTENKKKVVIINGDPGTGKSVLAINALSELLSKGLMGAYVSKNMAPRHVYKNKLIQGNEEVSVNELFKGSGFFFRDNDDKYDFLLVDEAHRLQEKSGLHNNVGENQIKEIINAAKLSVFFVDEKQIITLNDIGRVANIKNWAKEYKAEVYRYSLNSQFRCNGNDSYLDFVDKILYNKRGTFNFSFDFRVMDSPQELRDLIERKNTCNNARIVAGFCWNRKGSEADNQNYHDIVIGDFAMSWNLKHGEPFAIRESAINEIGCVHNVQGLEFDYIGVIIGPDLKYRDGRVITDFTERSFNEKSLYGIYVKIKKDKEYYEELADKIIRNTYRVLLTRGIRGCYVYACDKELQRHLVKILEIKNKTFLDVKIG